MQPQFGILREALWRLSLNAEQQRTVLAGTVVTDELALDLDNAVKSLRFASAQAGVVLSPEFLSALSSIEALFAAAPGDPLWDDESLDHHEAWASARAQARQLQLLLPPQGV